MKISLQNSLLVTLFLFIAGSATAVSLTVSIGNKEETRVERALNAINKELDGVKRVLDWDKRPERQKEGILVAASVATGVSLVKCLHTVATGGIPFLSLPAAVVAGTIFAKLFAAR